MHCSNRLAPVGKDAVKCRSCGVRLMLVLIFALLLVSCGNKLTSGEVYEKSFTEAHIEIVMVPFVHSDGKTSYTTMTPMYYRYPDTWEIAIKAWDPERKPGGLKQKSPAEGRDDEPEWARKIPTKVG